MFLWGLHFVNKAKEQYEAEQRAKAQAEAAAPPAVAAVPDDGGQQARPAAA
jgi:hypothetical protein